MVLYWGDTTSMMVLYRWWAKIPNILGHCISVSVQLSPWLKSNNLSVTPLQEIYCGQAFVFTVKSKKSKKLHRAAQEVSSEPAWSVICYATQYFYHPFSLSVLCTFSTQSCFSPLSTYFFCDQSLPPRWYWKCFMRRPDYPPQGVCFIRVHLVHLVFPSASSIKKCHYKVRDRLLTLSELDMLTNNEAAMVLVV